MRFAPLLVLALTLGLPIGAQEGQSVLRVHPFDGDALSPGEATALQNLITSYVVELRAFRVIDAAGQELALKEAETAVQLGVPKDVAPLAADYLLTGNATQAGGLIVFTLDVTKVATGEKRSVSETASSVNELILASRRLTRNLFDLSAATAAGGGGTGGGPGDASPAAEAGGEAAPSGAAGLSSPGQGQPASGAAQSPAAYVALPTLSQVVGAWRGDKGLDRVSLFADGRGIAILSSGASMRVRASIEGSSIVVSQDQDSIPEYYRSPGLDYAAAKQVAAQARPWKWVFSLTTTGDGLVGIKESVFVRVDVSGVVSVDNNYVRDAAWTRLFR